jgi:ABC-type multidrug transport system ATPase subunit
MNGCEAGSQMLKVRGLRKDFLLYRGLSGYFWPERRTILRDLDLRLEPGQVAAIEGSNGSGKTTLLKLIAGLLAPTAGTVEVAASPGSVGITVADSRSFYWRLTCRQNLAFFGALCQLEPAHLRKRMEAISERLGIGSQLDDPFMTLSSGQMQRLTIVRTLLAEPQLWLLDEVTRSLDEAGRNAVADELKLLRARGGSALWVGHDRRDSDLLCDVVYRLGDGRLVPLGGEG